MADKFRAHQDIGLILHQLLVQTALLALSQNGQALALNLFFKIKMGERQAEGVQIRLGDHEDNVAGQLVEQFFNVIAQPEAFDKIAKLVFLRDVGAPLAVL